MMRFRFIANTEFDAGSIEEAFLLLEEHFRFLSGSSDQELTHNGHIELETISSQNKSIEEIVEKNMPGFRVSGEVSSTSDDVELVAIESEQSPFIPNTPNRHQVLISKSKEKVIGYRG